MKKQNFQPSVKENYNRHSKITVYQVLFKCLYYNYTDKNNVQQLNVSGSLRLINVIIVTLRNEAAHVTLHEMFRVQNLKRTRSMENQKHIYSDLHELNPPVWSHKDTRLSLFQALSETKWKFCLYHHDIHLLWIK